MGKEVPFKEPVKCDNCRELGAYDFMGDYLCGNCFSRLQAEYEREALEDEQAEMDAREME